MAFARLFGKNKKDTVEQLEGEGEEGREKILVDAQDIFAGSANEARQGEDTPSVYPRYLLDYNQSIRFLIVSVLPTSLT